MMFLRVFCVVLYFHSGARSHPFNNNESILQQQQKRIQLSNQSSVGIYQNPPYNYNYPFEVSNQKQSPIPQQPVKKINEPYLVHRGTSGLKFQDHSPPLIMTEVSDSQYQVPKRENSLLVKQSDTFEYLHNPSLRKIYMEPPQPQGDIKEPLRFNKPQIIPIINSKNSPLLKPEPEESLRLELPGITPENIKYLTRQQPFGEKHQYPRITYSHPKFDLKYTPQPDNKNYAMATSQNPSAESVYKLKQALPYKINTQQVLNNSQGNKNNNVLINSRRIEDIYKTEKPKKRYTIIHPDGRIEELDQVDGFFEKNPNYVVIKFKDIMNQVQGGQHLIPSPVQFDAQKNEKITVLKNKDQPSDLVEMNRKNNAFKEINNTVNIPVINNTTSVENSKFPVLNVTNNDKIVNNVTDLTTNNLTFLTEETNYTTIPSKPEITTLLTKNLAENNYTHENTSSSENKKLKPFQNKTNLSMSEIEYEDVISPYVFFNSSSTTVGPIIYDDNFTDIIINTTETPIANKNFTLNNDQRISNDTNGNGTQTLQIENSFSIFTDTIINTTETPITNENITLSTEQEISNDTNGNETQTLQIEKESNDLVTPTVYSSPIPNSENTTENSAFWFKADENFWDKIIYGNSSQNSIYFFFLSPKNTEKEIKTITYPNGTTIEEVTETITEDDGEPTTFKSTTVKNNTTSSSSVK